MRKRKIIFVLLLALLPLAGWSQTTKQSIYWDGQVIVKFKTGQIQTRGEANNNVDAALQLIGGTKAEQLMPRTSAISAQRRAFSRYDDRKSEPRDLSGLYVLNFDKSQSVKSIIEKLKQLDDVVYAEPNYIRRAFGTATDYTSASFFDKQWYLQAINMPYLWEQPIVNEKRPVIAILDSGVDFGRHPNLKGQWTDEEREPVDGEDNDGNGFIDDYYGWNFVNNGNYIYDGHGHGTHCAGIAAGMPDHGEGIVGANPDARILDVKVLDNEGLGDDATIIMGVDYAVATNADIISMSWGGYVEGEALREALERASQHCILVSSAGNDGLCVNSEHAGIHGADQCTPAFPASYPFVLAVQATDEQGELASFSNYDCDGPYLSTSDNNYNYDVRAPGVNMLSSYPTFGELRGVSYKRLNGTSMACPLVAGAISRLMQCGKVTDFNSLRNLLIKTSGMTIDMKVAYDATAETINAATFQCNINGVTMTFHKTSETTAQMGDGVNPAISTETFGSITVPNDVHGLLVTSVAANAFKGCGQLTEVILPYYINNVGAQAFSGCSQLSHLLLMPVSVPICVASAFDEVAYTSCHVEVPPGCLEAYQTDPVWSKFSTNLIKPLYVQGEIVQKEIGDYSFTMMVTSAKDKKLMLVGVEPLREETDGIVTVPEYIDDYQITSIGDGASNAFNNRTWLKQVVLPDCITEFPYVAFAYCPNLETVNYPTALTRISENAFWNCKSFKNGCIPGSVKEITPRSFENTGIEELILGEGVERIEQCAINECMNLKKIHIPSTVISIFDDFGSLPAIESIEVAEGNLYYDSRDNCNAIISTKEHLLLRGCRNTIIPSEVTKLGSYAFFGTRGLIDLNIPKRIEFLSSNTFRGCSDLQHITVEPGNSRYYSPNESNAIIENSELLIGCSNTIIPEFVNELSVASFANNDKVTSITIPTTMDIGGYAFLACPLVKVTSLSKKPKAIADYAFYDDGYTGVQSNTYETATLYVPHDTKEIYQATEGWKRFQNIVELDPVVTGDIDGNGRVNETDHQALIDHLLGKNIDGYNPTAADVDGDGRVNMRDVVALADVLAGKALHTDEEEAGFNIADIGSIRPGYSSNIRLFVNRLDDGDDQPVAHYARIILPDGITFNRSQELKADGEGFEIQYVINDYQADVVVFSPDNKATYLDIVLQVDVTKDVPKDGFYNKFCTVVTASGKIREECGFAPFSVVDVIPGDLTYSGSVDVQDATITVNYILGKESGGYDYSVADMNNDGEIDVFDVTAIINVILNNGSGNRAPARRAIQQDYWETIRLTADENGLLFDIDNANRFTSFQFDVEVPEGADLLGIEYNGKTSHILKFAKNGENRYTVVALSMASTPLSAFDDALLKLHLSDTTRGNVRIDNVLFVTPDGKAVHFNGATTDMATGVKGIASSQGEQIYDISGRQLNTKRKQLSKGIYIINNKKVLIKNK